MVGIIDTFKTGDKVVPDWDGSFWTRKPDRYRRDTLEDLMKTHKYLTISDKPKILGEVGIVEDNHNLSYSPQRFKKYQGVDFSLPDELFVLT